MKIRSKISVIRSISFVLGVMLVFFNSSCTNNKNEPKSDQLDSVNKIEKETNNSTSIIDTIKQNKVETDPTKHFPNISGFAFNPYYTEIRFSCPKFSSSKEYLDIEFTIKNSSILDKIALIQVDHLNTTSKKDNKYFKIFLLPELGLNRIRLKSLKDKGSYTLKFGVLFKESRDAKFPHLNGIECTIEKN